MLSAYLDGELNAPERVEVEARLAESAEWRAELDEVRAARDAVRALPARDAPAGFWDAVLAGTSPPTTARADDAGARRVDRVAPTAPPRRRGSRAAAAIVVGAGRGDRGAAPQRGDAQRDRGRRPARRAGLGRRRPDQHARAGRPAGRVPPMITDPPAGDPGVVRARRRRRWLADRRVGAARATPRRARGRRASWRARATRRRSTTSPATAIVTWTRSATPRAGRRSRSRRRRRDRDRGRRRRHRDRRGSPHLSPRPARVDRRRSSSPPPATCPAPAHHWALVDSARPAPSPAAHDRGRGDAGRRRPRRNGCSSTTTPACSSAARCSDPTGTCSARCGSSTVDIGAGDGPVDAAVGRRHREGEGAVVGARRIPRAAYARRLRARRRARSTPTASCSSTATACSPRRCSSSRATSTGARCPTVAPTPTSRARAPARTTSRAATSWCGRATGSCSRACPTRRATCSATMVDQLVDRDRSTPESIVDYVLGPFGWN